MSEHDGESEGHNTYSLDQQELELVRQVRADSPFQTPYRNIYSQASCGSVCSYVIMNAFY